MSRTLGSQLLFSIGIELNIATKVFVSCVIVMYNWIKLDPVPHTWLSTLHISKTGLHMMRRAV